MTSVKHIFGMDRNVGFCTLGNKIVYAAANKVVIHDLETNSQEFIDTLSTNEGIKRGRAVCLATNDPQTLLAVALKGNEVKIYDAKTLKCKNKLHHDPKIASDVSNISFSRESFILTLTKEPDFTMTLFTINESTAEAVASLKLSTVMKGAVFRADFSLNSSLISVIGPDEIRLFRPSTKMKPRFFPLSLELDRDQKNYTVQCWLQSGDLVVATKNKIFVIGEDRSMKQVIESLPKGVRCITRCNKGCSGGPIVRSRFAVGCDDGKFFIIQQSDDDGGGYIVNQSMVLPEMPAIDGLGLVSTTNCYGDCTFQVVCLSETNELFRFPLECDEEVAIAVPSLNKINSTLGKYIPSFGFISVDTSIWLPPLVAIGGYDGILRIFNRCTKKNECCHPFHEPITCVSFHYTGKYILLSTSKKVYLCSIHQQQLKILWRVDLTVSAIKFSPGGDRFGIVINAVVQVHDFHLANFQNVNTLRGHSKPIIAFEFGLYSDEGCTIGADAIICLWDCRKGVALKRINLSCASILSGCIDWTERCVLVTTSDHCLKKVTMEGKALLDVKCEYEDRFHRVLPSKNVILSNKDTLQSVQIQAGKLVKTHLAHVERLASVAYAQNDILIAGDGCLAIYHVNEKMTDNYVSLRAPIPQYHPFENVILSPPSVLEHTENEIITTENMIKSLTAEHASTLQTLTADAELQMRQSNDSLHEELERVRSESSRLIRDIEELKVSTTIALDELKAEHKSKMLHIRNESDKKIAKEKDNIVAYERRCEEVRQSRKYDIAQEKENHARTIERETNEFHQLMTEANSQCEDIIKSIEAKKLEVRRIEESKEYDTEKEMSELWLAHHEEMKRIKRSNQLLLNEKSILQQRYNTMLDDLKELQEQISSQEESQQTSTARMGSLCESIESHKNGIIEKDRHIAIKESDMRMFSQANLEEEQRNADIIKDRMDLEEYVKPLADELQCKESLLSELTKQIKSDANILSNLNAKLDGAKAKLKHARQQLAISNTLQVDKESYIISLEHRLFIGDASALNCMHDYQALKKCLRSIADEFLSDKSHKRSTAKADMDGMLMLKSLEKKVSTLKKSIEQKKKTHTTDMNRLKREHAVLIQKSKASLEIEIKPKCYLQPAVLNANASNNIIERQNNIISNLEMKTLKGEHDLGTVE